MAKKADLKATTTEQTHSREIDMSRFPPATHCMDAARTLGVPVIECPRRPSHRVPFCWLDAEGAEHWLAYACGATEGPLQEIRHREVIRVMLRALQHNRIVVLLYGRNEPVVYEGRTLDTGYPEFAVYHELFTDQGSVAQHSAQYAPFWRERERYYREFRVPGPEKLPDAELSPLVARNRCHLLPPTEPRESLWTKYGGKGEIEQYDEDGNPIAPKPRPSRAPRASLPKKEKGKKPPRAEKAPPRPKPEKAPKPPKPEKAPKPKPEPKPAKGSARFMLDDLLRGPKR